MPVTLGIYFSLSRFKSGIYQRIFLISASLVFYGYQNPYYLALIISSIIVNYTISSFIIRKSNLSKLLLVVGIIFNIVLLGYFKYFNFLIDNVNFVFKTSFFVEKIMLPLGISFFTFQQLSFLISVYKKEQQLGKFSDYALFVVFFPQLVAGPIVLYNEMMPQFEDNNIRFINLDNVTRGIYIFAVGLCKKVVLADTLSIFVDNGFNMENLGVLPALVTTLSYTMQLYFDFSGYCDMAIGIGKMFNINLPNNFNSPYKSDNISEFWRRWHMTLGRALSTYVYYPLGGSRKGLARTCVNLMITFLLSGLWHGASWTFILWGGVHGFVVVLERIFNNKLSKLPRTLRTVLTFALINIFWVLFRAENFEKAMNIYRGLFNFDYFGFDQLKTVAYDPLISFPVIIAPYCMIIFIFALLFIIFRKENSQSILRKYKPTYRTALIFLALYCCSVIFMSKESVFIYFNF